MTHVFPAGNLVPMAAFSTVDDGGVSPRYDSPTPPHSTGLLLTSDFSQARATDL
jgi:hypothetical protein